MKKRLIALLLALMMVLGMLGITSAYAAGEHYIGFTSDTHNSSTSGSSGGASNLTKFFQVVHDDIGKKLDYMGFCGDHGDSGQMNDNYWSRVQKVIDIVDSSDYVDNYIFINGNHEWYNGKVNSSNNSTAKLMTWSGKSFEKDDYVIYTLGSTDGDMNGSFETSEITKLDEYLKTVDKSKPVFVMSHYPLHSYGGRNSKNADELIKVLNGCPNVIFLWGHNHSVWDTYYDNIYEAGSVINTGTSQTIKFTYAAAGHMAGGQSVDARGLLVKVDGSDVTFTYYDANGKISGPVTVDVSKGTSGDDGDDGNNGDDDSIVTGTPASGDYVIVVDGKYALTSASGSSGLAAQEVTISGGKIISECNETMSWNIKNDDGHLTIKSNDGGNKWLSIGASGDRTLKLSSTENDNWYYDADGSYLYDGDSSKNNDYYIYRDGSTIKVSRGGSNKKTVEFYQVPTNQGGDNDDDDDGDDDSIASGAPADGDYVIVINGEYALTTETGSYTSGGSGYTNTYSGLKGEKVDIANGQITSDCDADMSWHVTNNNGALTIQNNSTNTYLNGTYSSSGSTTRALTLKSSSDNGWRYDEATKFLQNSRLNGGNCYISMQDGVVSIRSTTGSDYRVTVEFYPVPTTQACQHTSQNTVVDVVATCATPGEQHKVCADCGDVIPNSTENVGLNPANHAVAPTTVPAVAATCMTPGNAEYTYCTACNTVVSGSNEPTAIDPNNHNWSEDWTFDGVNHWHVCLNGCTVTTTPAAHTSKVDCDTCDFACNHENKEIRTKVEADCVTKGVTHEVCMACETPIEGTEVEGDVNPANHAVELTHVPHKAETCTADGVYEHYKCEKCNKTYSDENGANEKTDVVIKGGHKLEPAVAQAATCIKTGTAEHYLCNACNKFFIIKDEVEVQVEAADLVLPIDLKNHAVALTHVAAQAATCLAAGNIDHFLCSACGNTFSDEKGQTAVAPVIQKLEHEAETEWQMDENDHWHDCANGECGTKFNEGVHKYQLGTQKDKCETCGYERNHKHNPILNSGEQATCTATGIAVHYTCSGCSLLFKDEACTEAVTREALVTAKLPHDVELVPGTAATCIAGGQEDHYKCKTCGTLCRDAEGKVEVTAADLLTQSNPDNHKMPLTVIAEDPATCTETGTMAHYKCEDCKKLFSDDKGKNVKTLAELEIAISTVHYGEEAWTPAEDGHYHACANGCDYRFNVTAHEFGDDDECDVCKYKRDHTTHKLTLVPAVQVTCAADGKAEHYKCSGCDMLFKDANAEEQVTEAQLIIKSSTVHKAVEEWAKTADKHYHACANNCSYHFDEAAHEFGDDDICDVCEYERAHEHDKNLTKVKKVDPTCDTDGKKEHYTCSGCDTLFIKTFYNKYMEVSAESLVIDKNTVHKAAEAWMQTETHHYHACANGCEVKFDEAAHNFGDDDECDVCKFVRTHVHALTLVTEDPATCTENGTKAHYVCACGAKFMDAEGTIPTTDEALVILNSTVHKAAEDWKMTETHHYHDCANNCGAKFDEAEHIFGNDDECDVCKYKKDLVIAGIGLDKEVLNLKVNGRGVLLATVMPEGTTVGAFTWASVDESVAVVIAGNNGASVVKAIGVGTTKVTVTIQNGMSAECVVNVTCAHVPGALVKSDDTGHWLDCQNGCGEKVGFAQHFYGDDDACDACGFARDHVHAVKAVAAVEATCTENGVKAHFACSGCNAIFLDEAGTVVATANDLMIEVLGHDWKDSPDGFGKVCDRCGATEAGDQTLLPDTGDRSNIFLMFGIMLISSLLAFVLGRGKKIDRA